VFFDFLPFSRFRYSAKAKLAERERAARQSTSNGSALNASNKRPLTLTSAESTSPTAPTTRSFPSAGRVHHPPQSSSALQAATSSGGKAPAAPTPLAPLPRDSRLGQYVEFDLSKLHNSKGGFLVEEEDDNERSLRQRRQVEQLRAQRIREGERIGLGQEPRSSILSLCLFSIR
jgi:DNA-repair protein complementing XP-A cells